MTTRATPAATTIDSRSETEVCVIGAGPAGSVCAKRLSELGHQVLLVERHPFPRPHVGEALTPAVRPLLHSLGVLPAVRDAGFLTCTESSVRWADDLVRHVRLPAGAAGLTVCRGRFDRLLLDAARSAGVGVLEPAVARRPRREADGWKVLVTTPEGAQLLRARFLVDATGRARVLGGRVTRTGPRTIALHTAWHVDPDDAPATCVEALPDGWLWGTLLPSGDYRVMAFTDPEHLRRSGVRRSSLESYFRSLLAGSELFHRLARDRPGDTVSVCDATSYFHPDPAGEDHLRLGEAAFAIDPLSSSGVEKALQSAMSGAVTAHTLLSEDGDRTAALTYYRDSQRHSAEQHVKWAGGHYAEHRPYQGNVFWRRRALPLPALPALPADTSAPASPTDTDLAHLMHRRLRLTPTAELVSTPCVVGDQVSFRPALSHPALARPVAYLGGLALAPLTESLSGDHTLAETLRTWTRTMAPEQAMGIARWLHEHHMVTVVG
ncbi:NAD(P)/FAD-dependent oxidoreductase [Streptomyces roseoverticillatus]|uniref:flavin-dependent monooxygenase QhpG n=1 Tax=Streptomyces roseoverticillatus TaxID=66429 RepID=UPI001F39C38E|nr:NAD(P)/FAD-dependent oxidoreductase [Streptomyces roseoverticillatus]MCF3103123.1 NAD(P)/FAD-dependent oxidoreductase [Streptomyces roseoverticillatus]